MTKEERTNVFFNFMEKYPNVRGLDLTTQKNVLDGELIMVILPGKFRYFLLTKKDIKNGMLKKVNKVIKNINTINNQKYPQWNIVNSIPYCKNEYYNVSRKR